MDFLLRIVLVFILIGLNAFFVASEFSLVSIRRTRIRELVKLKNKGALKVDNALRDIETVISATQLGITIASIALGWIGEPTVAALFHPLFAFLPEGFSLISSHALSVTLAFVLITIMHIVLGELVPKSIALQKTEQTVMFIISPLQLFSRIFAPAIFVLNGTGTLILHLFGLRSNVREQALYSEDEIKLILDESKEGGVIEEEEAAMVNNVFDLADIPVKEVMVQRGDIIAFSDETPFSEVLAKIHNSRHSRYPVYHGSLDGIVGQVTIKDIYRYALADKKDVSIAKTGLICPILFVPNTEKVDDVLRLMRKKRIRLAVVTEKSDKTVGLVSIEDILESVVGELNT
jgi:CBS domain containing-hemolysin-like protein